MNEPYVLSRRERKKRNCKYTILQSARELIMLQGLDVPIEEIANRADISYPTFYNYFPTKASLFYAIYLEEIEDLQEFSKIALKDETSAEQRIVQLSRAILRDFSRYRYLDLYLAGEVAKRTAERGGEEAISQMFFTAIQSGVQSGEFRRDLDVRQHALLISGVILSASFFNCGNEDCDGMLSILLSGMRAQPNTEQGA